MPVSAFPPIRLRRAALRKLPPSVSVPSYHSDDLATGVVHLGFGSFARAHTAVYFDRIAEAGISRDWGMVGAGLCSSAAAGPLRTQDGLWTVVDRGAGTARVVGPLRGYVDAVAAPGRLIDRLAAPTTRLVTLSVTAPTYDRDQTGDVFDLLAAALDCRRATGVGPVTVLSCDNLRDSGGTMRTAVLRAAHRRSDALATWIERNVTFPAAMVDRITPFTTDADREELCRNHGVLDRLAVFPEPFSQWVVADEFAAGRPPLDEVGAQVVSDVQPYVEVKSRMLNASHLALGFLGGRAGHETTAQAMTDPETSALIRRLMRDEVAPLLPVPPAVDLDHYRRSVIARLADPCVADTLVRLRRRGSVRVRNYLLPSLRAALEAGRPHTVLTAVLAGWVSHLAQAAADPQRLAVLEDRLAPTLAPLAARAHVDPRRLLGVTEVFGDLGRHPGLADSLRAALSDREVESRAAAS